MWVGKTQRPRPFVFVGELAAGENDGGNNGVSLSPNPIQRSPTATGYNREVSSFIRLSI